MHLVIGIKSQTDKRVLASIYVYGAGVVLFLYLVPTIHSVLRTAFDPLVLGGPVFSERTWTVVLRSLKMSLLTAVGAVLCCVGCLYNFGYQRPFVRKMVLVLLVMPLFIPETFSGLTLLYFASKITLPKGWILVSLVETIWVLPFVGVILILRINGIPDSIYKSAKDLNLNGWSYFSRIFTPLTWKTWIMGGVFAFVLAFNEFTRAYYLQSRELFSTYLVGHLSSGANNDVYIVSTLITVVGLLLLYFLGKAAILDVKRGKA